MPDALRPYDNIYTTLHSPAITKTNMAHLRSEKSQTNIYFITLLMSTIQQLISNVRLAQFYDRRSHLTIAM